MPPPGQVANAFPPQSTNPGCPRVRGVAHLRRIRLCHPRSAPRNVCRRRPSHDTPQKQATGKAAEESGDRNRPCAGVSIIGRNVEPDRHVGREVPQHDRPLPGHRGREGSPPQRRIGSISSQVDLHFRASRRSSNHVERVVDRIEDVPQAGRSRIPQRWRGEVDGVPADENEGADKYLDRAADDPVGRRNGNCYFQGCCARAGGDRSDSDSQGKCRCQSGFHHQSASSNVARRFPTILRQRVRSRNTPNPRIRIATRPAGIGSRPSAIFATKNRDAPI